MRPRAESGAPRSARSALDVAGPSGPHDAAGWRRTKAAAAGAARLEVARNLPLHHSTAGAEAVVATWIAAAAANYCWAVEAA